MATHNWISECPYCEQLALDCSLDSASGDYNEFCWICGFRKYTEIFIPKVEDIERVKRFLEGKKNREIIELVDRLRAESSTLSIELRRTESNET